DAIELTPGEPVVVTLEVFNTTDLVDQFELAAVGINPEWVKFSPPALSLFPSTAGTAEVTILVDSAYGYTAGRHVIGFRAQSSVNSRLSSVIEVAVEVAATPGATLDLHPQSARVGRAGAFLAVARNLGNAPLELDIRGGDPEGALRFECTPDQLTIQPGDEAWTVIQVRGRRPFIGMDAARPFTVLGVMPDADAEPLTAEGMLLQKPWLPAFAGQIASLVILGAILLGAYLVGTELTKEAAPEAAAEATKPPEPGALGTPAVVLDQPRAGGSGVVTVSFTTGAELPSGGAIAVTFPEGFTPNVGGNTALARADRLGFDGGTRLRIEGRRVTVTRAGNGGTTKAGSPITLPLTNIGNPAISGEAEVAVETLDGAGNPLDAGKAMVKVTPGALRDASVVLDPLAAGSAGTATVTIALANDLPPDGVVRVQFPEGFVVKDAILDAATQSFTPPEGTTLNRGGTLGIKVEERAVSVIRNNDGEAFKARTRMMVTLAGVRNAGVSGPTGTFTIETRNAAGVVIDTADAPGVALTGGALSGLVATLENPRAGATGAATLFFTMPAELPPSARVEVRFPGTFALNEGGATTVQNGALAGADGTASAVVLDQSVTVLRNNDGKVVPAGTAIAVTLTNVKNPAAAGAAGPIHVSVLDGTGRLIADGDTAAVAINAAPPAPASAPATTP
ncbi:MAG: hypothetical protein AB7G21_05540, partial [Dehalococcoidia bacterium]